MKYRHRNKIFRKHLLWLMVLCGIEHRVQGWLCLTLVNWTAVLVLFLYFCLNRTEHDKLIYKSLCNVLLSYSNTNMCYSICHISLITLVPNGALNTLTRHQWAHLLRRGMKNGRWRTHPYTYTQRLSVLYLWHSRVPSLVNQAFSLLFLGARVSISE